MDVTARYEAELARDRLIWMLETERSRMSEIIEALPVGVGIVGADGRVILGNAVMKRLIGPVIQSMTAAPRGQWIALDAEGAQIAPEDFPIRRALRLGETTFPGVEFLYCDPDGKETWYRAASLPLRWEGSRVEEALAIFQDVDAEKRLLDIREQTNLRLEQASARKSPLGRPLNSARLMPNGCMPWARSLAELPMISTISCKRSPVAPR